MWVEIPLVFLLVTWLKVKPCLPVQGQSPVNLGKSILSRSVDTGNDLFTQTELSSSEVTGRIAWERPLSSPQQRLKCISSGHTQYFTDKHTLVTVPVHQKCVARKRLKFMKMTLGCHYLVHSFNTLHYLLLPTLSWDKCVLCLLLYCCNAHLLWFKMLPSSMLNGVLGWWR